MMNTNSTSRFKTTRSRRRHVQRLPYYEQAKTWYRFLRRLRDKPFDAYLKKEEALAHSIQLRGRAFVVPSRLDSSLDIAQGLPYLQAHLDGGQRFVELAPKIVQIDENDPAADEVHLFLEASDPTSSRNRRLLAGRLPHEDAFWMVPLLRMEGDAYGTGPVLQIFACRPCPAERGRVQVVIARAHEAARNWMDWRETRRSYRVGYAPASW